MVLVCISPLHAEDQPAPDAASPPKVSTKPIEHGFGCRKSSADRDLTMKHGGTRTRNAPWPTPCSGYIAINYPMEAGSSRLKKRCSDHTCTGPGVAHADAGATAMGLLPFLAAGQTHKTKGPFRDCIKRGLLWFLRHQDVNGNLAKGDQQPMYSHGLATMALCEAYGMTKDRNLGAAAQQAVNYIVAAQNQNDHGWRDEPGMAGDTSVTGWQFMALKSARWPG